MTELRLRTGTIRVRARGPLLIGGHSPPPPGVDATTAIDRSTGRPIVPASALRGALREALTRLSKSNGEPACGSGEGCSGATLCGVCAVFGPPGPDRPFVTEDGEGEGGLGVGQMGLRFGDATLAIGDSASRRTRHGVAIDRFTRTASTGRLFQRSVAELGDGRTFEARFRARLEDEHFERLIDAARLVSSIGNSQSRGYGRVAVEIVADEEPVRSISVALRNTDLIRANGRARVVVNALEPLYLGGVPNRTSFAETLRFVPGSALHGALAAAALRAGLDEHDPRFRALADRLSLSDAWPQPDAETPTLPAAATVVVCRACDETRDDVLREASVRFANDILDLRLPIAPALCAVCSDRPAEARVLTPLEGCHPSASLRTRVVTRLARDPFSGSFAPGFLYSREQIEAGAIFGGTAFGLDAAVIDAIEIVRRAGEPIHLGGLRRRGLGSVEVSFERITVKPRDVEGRVSRFRAAAVERLGELAARIEWRPDRLVQVVARTPIAHGHRDGRDLRDVADRIATELFGAPGRVLGRFQRTVRRAGWNDWSRSRANKAGPRPIRVAARAGSVWLFEVDGDLDFERIDRLQIEGVGDDRALGLGRVVVCPSW